MKVHVPTPLRSYTKRESVIVADGSTVEELLADIDRRYPGFRFRIIDEQGGIREHVKIFVNEDQVRTLSVPCRSTDVIHIICALSGGGFGYLEARNHQSSTGPICSWSPTSRPTSWFNVSPVEGSVNAAPDQSSLKLVD